MKKFDAEKFTAEFWKEGSVIIENVLSPDFVRKMTQELEGALQKEVEYQGTTDYSFYGYVLVNAIYGGTFLDIWDNPKITEPINAILGEGSIAYSYTSSSMPPGLGNDSSHIHMDCPVFIPNYILRMGVLIPLVDLTEENGATYYWPGSHNLEQKPSEEEFHQNAKRLFVKAGTGWFFHTRLWHSGGINETPVWRHALTMNMCRPWMKQRVDIPSVMGGMDLSGVSEAALQKLGFHSQIPQSYDEYFAPPEKRKFRQTNL